MRTGVARPARRPLHLVRACTATVMAIAVAAASTACGDNSPVSVPTSTLPAQQPLPTEAAPTVPEYTTDLDLNDEEKKAVDGALLALDGYVSTLNRVFSSGGSDRKTIDQYAEGTALQTLTDDADDLQASNEVVVGKFEINQRSINEVRGNATEVSILTCVDNAKFKRQKEGTSLAPTTPELLTVEFVASSNNGVWKIGSQDLWSEQCAD